jgi:hypothetical protein
MEKIQHLYDAHELFNNYFFNGQLNHIKISVKDNIKIYGFEVWGYYDDKNYEIALTNNERIYLILLHEMIHQYQQEFNLIDKEHGTTFRKFARWIELSLNLKKGSI